MNRPRVSYLRKKMQSMDIQQDVFSAVSSNLFSSLRAVKKHVFSDNFKILHTSRSVGSLSMSKNDESLPKIDKTRLKIIKELKNTQINLKNNLFQLTQNENLLKSESFISLTGKTANTLDNSLHQLKLKKIAQSKERIMERISEIETKINTLIYQESKEEGLMKMFSKDKFQKFLENYENERENYNQRLNEITKESEIRRQRMLNDLENKISMKTKALQTQEEEKENLKKQKLLQNREEEKEKTSLRTKTNNQKLLRVKVFLNEKNQNKKYSYVEYAKKFEINEDKLIIKENKKRKQYMKHINNEEFIEFGKRLDEIKAKNEEELNNKSKSLKDMWNERENLIPSYVPPIYKECEKEKILKKKEENEKLEKLACYRSLKLEYSKNKIPKPKISQNIMNNNNENNKNNENEDEDQAMKKSKSSIGVLSMRHQMSNSFRPIKKYPKIEKKEISSPQENNANTLSPILVKKPRIIRRNNNKRLEPLPRPIDYLTEERIKKINRRRNNSNISHDNSRYISKDITKILQDGKGTIDENLYLAKNKIAVLENQAKQKEELLKLTGGAGANPELGNQVCDLMIDSIKAKLSILGKINNN